MRYHSVFFALACSILLTAGVPAATAQSSSIRRESPEDFRIEVTAAAWILRSGGQVQASGTPADFVNDLKVYQNNATFFGSLVFKPGRKHRILVEGTPFSIQGLNSINRPIVYRGQTFNVNQTVASTASLDYIYGGYQYDVLTGRQGHLGFNVGAAYLNATGTLAAQASSALASSSTTAAKNQKLALPLAGIEFRLFPIPRHKLIEVDGGIRGMTFGDYGYYGQALAQGGVCLGPFTLLAGYRAVNTSIYSNSNGSPSGITARLKGPIFSGMFRW